MDYSNYPRHDILCLDIRSFYASVEAMKLGLDPMKDMLAVVGDVNRPGSIVLAASPTLKEKYGISNVSRYFELPNAPNIHIAKASMADYLQVSLEITKLIKNYAPKEAIHQYSVDEVWLTVNGLEKLFGPREKIAQMLQNEIYESFGLNTSIGIGDNKFLAKVVMDLHAKKTGIAECTYESVEEMLWPHPVEKIWGIGSRMKRRLNRLGITQLGHIAKFDLTRLKKHFGIMGEQLYWHAWGVDLSPVYGNFIKTEQKGFGHGISLLRDYNKTEVMTCILELCEEVCYRARAAGKTGKTIHLSISYSNESAGGFSRSLSIDTPTDITMDMYAVCRQLFQTHYDGESSIRYVYVTLSNLFDKQDIQLGLFDNQLKKNRIGDVMDAIRNKHGATSLLRATSFTDAGILIDRSKKIGGHYA